MIIGIDPGLKGAIAFFEDGKIEAIFDMPTFEVERNKKKKSEVDVAMLVAHLNSPVTCKATAYLEKVGAMPKQGTSSMFSFGTSYGILLGVLGALYIPVVHVTPQKWKKALNVRGGKDASRLRASELMPNAASNWPLVKHDGRAEAALIAYYGRQLEGAK